MKYWTIQKKDIVNYEIYQPNFGLSRFPKNNSKLAVVYDFLLKSYNKVNKTNLPGLIFSFVKYQQDKILEIENIDTFCNLMKHSSLITFLQSINIKEDSIFELDYPNSFNPIFIEYNNFQTIMPPICLEFHSKEEISQILHSIECGEAINSQHPCGLFQAHLPNINKNNILNKYDINRLYH